MAMFTGKTALITGAAQGLGKAFATELLQRGCKVCAADINEDTLKRTVTEWKNQYGDGFVIASRCDVTKGKELEETFKQTKSTFSHIDIVVNNAGVVNENNWEKCLSINLTAVIRGSQLGLEYMRKDRGGQGGVIVNVSSVAGIFPVAFGPVYAASKHGVIGFTRSMGLHPEVKKNGVRLVCFCPAFTDTDILKAQPISTIDKELYQQALKDLGVMRVGQVSEAFLKLLADQDNSGSALVVNKSGTKYWNLPGAKM